MNPRSVHKSKVYIRQEHNGIVTICPKSGRNKNNTHFLNSVAYRIFTLCDGGHSEKDILDVLSKTYPDELPAELGRDLAECLHSLKQLGVIKWVPDKGPEGGRGHMRNNGGWQDGVNIEAIGEEDVLELAHFVNGWLHKMSRGELDETVVCHAPLVHPLPNPTVDLYSPFSIRTRHFHFLEVFYRLREGDEIVAAMSILNPTPHRKTVEVGLSIGELGDMEYGIGRLMDTVVDRLQELGVIKMKYLVPVFAKSSGKRGISGNGFLELIRAKGFSLEATLRDEVDEGVDMCIWSRRIK